MSLSMSERNRYIVCTFDDGYIGLLYNALPIMNKYGYTATVFVCSEYMGKLIIGIVKIRPKGCICHVMILGLYKIMDGK